MNPRPDPGTATLLVRVHGTDQPGITAQLMSIFSACEARVQDVEQVLLRGVLTLAAVVSTEDPRTLRKELLVFGDDMDLRVKVSKVSSATTRHRRVDVVTILGATITPLELSELAEAIGAAGGNIDRIVRLSNYPVISYEFRVTNSDPAELRRLVAMVGRGRAIDLGVQEEGLGRRAKRLMTIDVDSTLIQDEVIDLLAEEAGCADEVAALTERAMAGELDFEESVRARVALLAGLEVEALQRVSSRVRATPGARTFVRTLKRIGFHVAAVSGGFVGVIDDLIAELGIDELYANQLEVVDGRLTGVLVGPIVDRSRKAQILREVAANAGVPVDQTIAVGDGANDIEMLQVAGLGIAFNGKAALRDAADAEINVPYLDAILFLLGVARDEVERERLTNPNPPAV